MPYDDQRGRTGNFSTSLVMGPGGLQPPPATGQGGGTVNYGWTGAGVGAPEFLGGQSGGFLQGGGNGGGFTNFSQYLYANPYGGGENSPTGSAGANAIDAAMNSAYGLHNYGAPPPATDPGTGTGTGTTPTTGTGSTPSGTGTPLTIGAPGGVPTPGVGGGGFGGTGTADPGKQKHVF